MASYVVSLVMLCVFIPLHIILKKDIHHPYNSSNSHLIPAFPFRTIRLHSLRELP